MEFIGKSLISIDWLSIYVSTVGIHKPSVGSIRAMDYGTQVYKFTEYYQIDGKDIAVLTYQPRSSKLVQDTGIIKILNEYLYTEDIYTLCQNIMQDWGLVPLSVSRLDVCADFHRFQDYPDMNCFFEDFLTTKIWHMGKCKYKVIGEKARKLQDDQFVIQGVQSSRHTYQYLRFGGNTSDVSAYLYNKTKEFEEVKTKNYIVSMWEKNGLDTTKTVWRLEFSLKGNAVKIIDEVTGEVYFDKLKIIKDLNLVHRLYVTLYQRYWDFRINDGQVRKDRMKRCNLLRLNDMPFRLSKFYLASDSTIGDKRLISQMERVYQELRHADTGKAAIVNWAKHNLIEWKKLEVWATCKGYMQGDWPQ